jgi:hypothetical protein
MSKEILARLERRTKTARMRSMQRVIRAISRAKTEEKAKAKITSIKVSLRTLRSSLRTRSMLR